MNQWVINNPAAVVAFFTLLFGVIGFLATRKDRNFDATVRAKDATIELLNLKVKELEKEKRGYEDDKHSMAKHIAVMDETIVLLQKRISELESKQFFHFMDKGHITLNNGKDPTTPNPTKGSGGVSL